MLVSTLMTGFIRFVVTFEGCVRAPWPQPHRDSGLDTSVLWENKRMAQIDRVLDDLATIADIEGTPVSGYGAVTGVAACIGTSRTPCGYAGPFPLMGASSPTFKSYTASGTLATADNATQALQLQLTVTGGAGNLSALTGGVIKTRICAVVGQ